MSPLRLYLAGTASWFTAFGLQGVLFSWLVTMVLFETPEKVGTAQMALLLPGLLLLLVGGSLADHYGSGRVTFVAQVAAALAPLGLAAAIAVDGLSFTDMLIYAVVIGCIQAIITPARDGLLNAVSGGRVQRTVMLASLMQFGFQLVGVVLAGFADVAGAIVLLCTQSALLIVGAVVFRPLSGLVPRAAQRTPLMRSIREGAATVLASPGLRSVCLQNVAMGVFFMGSFIVTMPLLVREVFEGNAQSLSLVNGTNAFGLALTITVLLKFGDIHRQGRALLLAQGLGAIVLAVGGVAPTLPHFILVSFVWGVCGGMAMTMARTIMQELAPPDQRGRIMAFYSLTFMGAGPLGALLAGFLVSRYGPQLALMIAASSMGLVVLLVGMIGPLWKQTGRPAPVSA